MAHTDERPHPVPRADPGFAAGLERSEHHALPSLPTSSGAHAPGYRRRPGRHHGQRLCPFDAGFPDIIGLSHTLALRHSASSASVPTAIYAPCPSDVHQLSPVLFASLREPWVDTWTPQFPLHLLSSLSCCELEELLLFYLPHMPIDHHLAATRALLQRTPWSWGEAPTGGQP